MDRKVQKKTVLRRSSPLSIAPQMQVDLENFCDASHLQTKKFAAIGGDVGGEAESKIVTFKTSTSLANLLLEISCNQLAGKLNSD